MSSVTIDTPLQSLFEFDYDTHLPSLDDLYERAKRDQWNVSTDLNWDQEMPEGAQILQMRMSPVANAPFFERLTEEQKDEVGRRMAGWRLSQFLHGEQGALLVCGHLVDAVPDMDSKMCASAQVMDEARHVEVFRKYITKVDRIHPIDPTLQELLNAILETPDWRKKYIGMQIVVEGLALAAFRAMQMTTEDPLLQDILELVRRDESRHVGFGLIALTDAMKETTEAERAELEDFAAWASEALVARRKGADLKGGLLSILKIYEEFGVSVEELSAWSSRPGRENRFNKFMFADTIIPALRKLGLLTDRTKKLYASLGVDPDDVPLDAEPAVV